jgi:hypothetical protein
VTGGGLTWTLAARANLTNGTPGDAEIWQAYATSALSAATVTATLSTSAAASITVASFTGTANAVGATAAAGAGPSAPGVSLTTTGANSLVWGNGFDNDSLTARTPNTGQARDTLRTLATFIPRWLADTWGFESVHYSP